MEPLQGDFSRRATLAGRIFTPTAPIDALDLFSGREQQTRQVVDAANQKGQHAILYGERGVGKTSLANVLRQFVTSNDGEPILTPRVNCDGRDEFQSLWLKVFDEVTLTTQRAGAGFTPSINKTVTSARQLLGDSASPDSVRRALTHLSSSATVLVIIDEFDRLDEAMKRATADTIKALSDHAVQATILLVGVADSVGDLIREHQSVERALVQVQMPRMSAKELRQIVTKGLERLALEIEPSTLGRIVALSQGLPHYTHHLALNAARASLDSESNTIRPDHLSQAITDSVTSVQQSVREAYHDAIRSPRRENLFPDVLLACALATTDELGFFAPQDVRAPLQTITGKGYDIPAFAQHLKEFSEPKRGGILHKAGATRRFRYRFSNPLMQPFLIMKGVASGRVQNEFLDQMALRSYRSGAVMSS